MNTRQKSLKGGQRTEDYKREASRPSPTLTAQAGGFWQWERPATTVCADPRIPAPGYRTGTQRSLTPAIPAEQAASGDQEGTEAIKLTVEEALILQGFDPLYPVQGSRTKKFEQIGNAIPPALAYGVLEPLAHCTPTQVSGRHERGGAGGFGGDGVGVRVVDTGWLAALVRVDGGVGSGVREEAPVHVMGSRTCAVCPAPPTVVVVLAVTAGRVALCGFHGSELLAKGVVRQVTPVEVHGPAARDVVYGRPDDFLSG